MSFRMLQADVLSWAKDKDLLHSENADKQFMKFVEEVFEFKTEMDNWAKNVEMCEAIDYPFENTDFDFRNLKLEMGDVFVTLIILCKQLGIDSKECIDIPYEKISKIKVSTRIVSKQFMKFVEQVLDFKTELDMFEYGGEILKPVNLEHVKDEMGDIFVTLIILCEQIGIDPEECLSMAYEKIKNRSGKTINGQFIKEDLEE